MELQSKAWANFPVHDFVEKIYQKAEGVFLWVKLALDEFFVSPLPLESHEITSLLERLPHELREFYQRTIHRIPHASRRKVYTLLELIFRSDDVVFLEELLVAAGCAHGLTFQECKDLVDGSPRILSSRSAEEAARTLANLCGGLLEFVTIDSETLRGYVQFIHRTVRDIIGEPECVLIVRADLAAFRSIGLLEDDIVKPPIPQDFIDFQ